MGAISRKVEVKAAGKTLTLAELREFVEDLDRAGAVGTTVIGGRVNWGGTLKSVWATAIRFGDSVRQGETRGR
jgi:hypothetical protein